MFTFVSIVDFQGFCDGTRRYGEPAPF